MRIRPMLAGILVAAVWTARASEADSQEAESPIASDVAAIEARVARGEVKQAAADAQALFERTEKQYGPDARETADALLEHVRLQLLDSSYPRPDLQPLAERALRICEDEYGPEDTQVGSALEKLSLIAQRVPDTPAAQAYRDRAVAIYMKTLGPDHPRTLVARTGQATLIQDLGESGEARRLYEEVLAAYERTGTGAPYNRVQLLLNLGGALTNLGQWDEARRRLEQGLTLARASFTDEPVIVGKLLLTLAKPIAIALDFAGAAARVREAIAIFEKQEGPDSPNLALAFASLGSFLESVGDPVGALPHERRAVAASEKAFGPAHQRTLLLEISLASLLTSLGQTEEARPLLESARTGLTTHYGSDNPQLLAALGASARLELAEGNYEAARQFAEREIALAETVFGPDSGPMAEALLDATLVCLEIGNLVEARKLNERMMRVMGPEGVNHSVAYQVLALIERRAGNLAAAERAIDRAIEIEARFPEPRSSGLPVLISERAWILGARGKLTEAVRETRRVLGTLDEWLGASHPASAAARLTLADLLARTGRQREARPLFERALAASASLYGEQSVAFAAQQSQFAAFEALHGDRSHALRIALDAAATLRRSVRGTARYLTEREALAFESARDSGLGVALWVLGHTKGSRPSAGQVWDEVVRSRAVILDEMATRHRVSFGGGDPGLSALVRRAAAARERLSHLAAADSAPASSALFRESWDLAVENRDEIEREIARRAADRDAGNREEPSWRSLAARLQPSDAVVAYVQYDALPSPLAGPAPAEYLAFVLRREARSPYVVPIGPAGSVDALVADWRERVAEAPPALGGAAGLELEARGLAAGRALRQRIWDPVAAKLRGARRVFVVPDGSMNLVNLAALPDEAGGYLVESGPLFHVLSTERDLLAPPRRSRTTGGLLAVGGVDFDAAPLRAGESAAELTAVARPGKPARYRGAPPSCSELRSLRFDPLPGTEIEASTVSSLWNATDPPSGLGSALLLNGPGADEGSFKELASGRRVIQVATHGFFADVQCSDRASGAVTIGDNPLLQSGLAFAGANRRADASRKDVDDGMLTAEEIGSLDLTGTEWVVLSSCGSGMGRVVAGEGVLGLRRAFEVAGAATLVTTLWRVNDAATLDWVRELYRARLDGASTAEAVRSASLKVIAARRASGLSTVPLYWGAFVASGDWR